MWAKAAVAPAMTDVAAMTNVLNMVIS